MVFARDICQSHGNPFVHTHTYKHRVVLLINNENRFEQQPPGKYRDRYFIMYKYTHTHTQIQAHAVHTYITPTVFIIISSNNSEVHRRISFEIDIYIYIIGSCARYRGFRIRPIVSRFVSFAGTVTYEIRDSIIKPEYVATDLKKQTLFTPLLRYLNFKHNIYTLIIKILIIN